MPKRGKKLTKKEHHERLHKRHHRIKLATLFTSKLALAILSFTVGLYLGTFTHSTFAALMVAFALAIITYLFTVLHIVDYLRL